MLYKPCDCDAPYDNCYRCAVDFVITTVVGRNSCDHGGANEGLCLACRNNLMPDFKNAFARTASGSIALAKARANSAGLVGNSFDHPDSPGSIVTIVKQDPDLAAAELLQNVDADYLSFAAAKWFVSEKVRRGDPVPALMREWAFSAINGIALPPKQRGKHKGSNKKRDKLILDLLDQILEMGINVTSADRARGTSACHAIAEAFVYLGLLPHSYDSFLRVWTRRDSLRGVSFPERV